MAFKWHCITSSCAEVVYQEYLPAVVRWRYLREDWQEIEGNDYTLTIAKNRCPVLYKYTYQTISQQGDISEKIFTDTGVTGAIYNWGLTRVFENQVDQNLKQDYCGINSTPKCTASRAYRAWFYHDGGKQDKNRNSLPAGSMTGYTFVSITTAWGIKLLDLFRADGQPDNCGNCIFTVTKNGQIVHTETRDICPEVEKLPCRKSDEVKIVQVEKIPYLSAVEVADVGYDAIHVKGVPYPLPIVTPIPSECLNIYRQEIYDFLPEGDPDAPDEPVFGDFITQICSVPGCPPPAYGVVCRDDCGNLCQSCPSDTCAVECDGQICCYDESGIAVKTIALNNYCGGQS